MLTHFTLFTINYGHFLCQALTECCRYGEGETGDCHHITAILIHTEISQRAPSGHFHQSWGAIVYRYFHFFKTYSTPSNIPRISGFTKTYNRQCNVNLDCVCFVLLLVFAKCPHCSMQGKWEQFFKWGLENLCPKGLKLRNMFPKSCQRGISRQICCCLGFGLSHPLNIDRIVPES